MRKLGRKMLFLTFVIVGSSFSAFAQTEFEQILKIQKFLNNGENLMSSVLENDNFFRFYNLPNDETLYLSFEAVGDTSMMYGFLDEFDFDEFPQIGDEVAYEKMTFSWVFHDDFDNDDSVWPGELFIYHQTNMDVYTLKFITVDGKLIKAEGYIDGTQNFGEED
jgi:hypothetical protein